jgi:guanyl-specific ribonuclease Sa
MRREWRPECRHGREGAAVPTTDVPSTSAFIPSTPGVRPLDRKGDVLAAEVDRRMCALIGTQPAEARRILGAINGGGAFTYRTE